MSETGIKKLCITIIMFRLSRSINTTMDQSQDYTISCKEYTGNYLYIAISYGIMVS